MKVAVLGLWHLGLVTAACLAKAGHEVIGYDSDHDIIANLQQNQLPIFEPGLEELVTLMQAEKKLQFTGETEQLKNADVIWINFDTPVDENDIADIDFVIKAFQNVSSYVKDHALVLISSQLPVGTTRKIKQQFSNQTVRFGYIPENLRLGKAIQVFTEPDRFVVGLEDQQDQSIIRALLGAFTDKFIWMSIESAEMTKHALNAFLALSVTFINEVASLCEKVGANASEVEAGLKSEERIGPKAYLKAGSAIAGGTLLRDIHYLNQIGKKCERDVPVLSAVLQSNTYHKAWVQRKVSEIFSELKNKKIAVLGLTYKVNTNTLRRSLAIETCHWLHHQGAMIQAFDPAVKVLPENYTHFIQLKNSLQETLSEADAVIVATEWPDFKTLAADHLIENVNQPIVIDANGFLMNGLGNDKRIHYCSVGRSI